MVVKRPEFPISFLPPCTMVVMYAYRLGLGAPVVMYHTTVVI